MFRFWRPGTLSEAARGQAVSDGWNACLDEILKFLGEHQWVVEDGEIFCDGCGRSLPRQLAEMRR